MTQWLHPDGTRELVMFGDYECPHDARRLAARRAAARALRRGRAPRLAPLPGAAPAPTRDARRRGRGGGRRAGRLLGTAPPAARERGPRRTTRCSPLARAEGLDADRIAAELRNGTYAETVRADKQTGRELGLKRTPTFIADGEPWDGFYDVETLSELIA